MDAPNLVVLALVVIGCILGPRFVLESVGRTGDGIAALFVPPDRALGWPHGVQEGDEPWGWRETIDAGPGPGALTPNDDPAGSAMATAELREVGWFDVVELAPAVRSAHAAGLTIPVRPVQRARR